jgi:hypothetical protein
MKYLCIILLSLYLTGCAKPLPQKCLWELKQGKLYLTHYSPENEVWYNKEVGIQEFDEEEVARLRNTLK